MGEWKAVSDAFASMQTTLAKISKGGAGGKAVQHKNPASSSSPPSNALPGGRWRSEEKPPVHTKQREWKADRDHAVLDGTLPAMCDKLKPISERKDDKKAFEGGRCIIAAPHQCGVCGKSYAPMECLIICTKSGSVPDQNNPRLRLLKQKLGELTGYEHRIEGIRDYTGKDGDNDLVATCIFAMEIYFTEMSIIM